MAAKETDEKVLNGVQADRRGFVKRLLVGAAFAVPVMATFSIDGLTVKSAQAQGINNPPAAPEPSTLLLMGTGAVGLGIAAYRRSQKGKKEAAEPKASE